VDQRQFDLHAAPRLHLAGRPADAAIDLDAGVFDIRQAQQAIDLALDQLAVEMPDAARNRRRMADLDEIEAARMPPRSRW
jgi:hypothetical protein